MGFNLQNFRKSLHLSQRQIADNLNISQAFYSQMECGVRNVKEDIVNQLRVLYPNSNIDSFMTDDIPDILPTHTNAKMVSPINIPGDLWEFIKGMQRSLQEKDNQISHLIALLEEGRKSSGKIQR